MRSATIRRLRLLSAAALGGVVFQLSGCSVSSLGSFLSGLNPCGSVLNCDPASYNFLTYGYKGPGVDPNIDPFCTYPPWCADDPFVGAIGANAGNP